MIILWCMFVALVIYNLLDYYQTVALVGFGMEEANPIVLWIVGDGNWENILYAKIAVLTTLGILILIKQLKKDRI